MTVDQELFADTLPTYLTGSSAVSRSFRILRSWRVFVCYICGVGGIGKTRLAIELAKILRANSFAHSRSSDTFWVPLVAVTDPGDVSAVGAGIGLQGPTGERVLAMENTLRDRPASSCSTIVNTLRRMS